METEQILKVALSAKKGKWVRLVKSKELAKGLIKYTCMTVRLGVDYSHMQEVGGKQVGGLPWGEWLKGYENLVITHKGVNYLRVANAYTKNTRTYYTLNGATISEKEAIIVFGKKDKGCISPVYNIDFKNIVSIG